MIEIVRVVYLSISKPTEPKQLAVGPKRYVTDELATKIALAAARKITLTRKWIDDVEIRSGVYIQQHIVERIFKD